MRRIAINARDGTPHDAYVYHYSFNHSCLVDVVRMLFRTQRRLQYQHRLDETFPAFVAEYTQLG